MAETNVDNFEEENSVTMLDVLQEENQLEEDAKAVLGASDDKNCTYNKGYIRQALYACKTCCPDQSRAGICLACSFQCHEGHELVELYTKRHFRCDCGNSKFGDKKCNLEPIKSEVNEENKYNQNFNGVYCTCTRPYPDPESTNDDEMLQCVLCEDWYHSQHLGCETSSIPENYDEMICAGCMSKHTFLWKYAFNYSDNRDAKKEADRNNDVVVDVENVPTSCNMPLTAPPVSSASCFLLQGWRSNLCTCENCKKLYEDSGVTFLLDPMDSVQVYEEAGKASQTESQYERGLKALASLGHVQQLTAIEEYNNMKERLKEYLQKFAENKKIVREEDIKEFFSGMEAKKRQKVVVPTFCR